MTGYQTKMGKYPSGSKPLQLRGLGMEMEIFSLSETSTAKQYFLERKECDHVHHTQVLGEH